VGFEWARWGFGGRGGVLGPFMFERAHQGEVGGLGFGALGVPLVPAGCEGLKDGWDSGRG
jgi:hypothetical protein